MALASAFDRVELAFRPASRLFIFVIPRRVLTRRGICFLCARQQNPSPLSRDEFPWSTPTLPLHYSRAQGRACPTPMVGLAHSRFLTHLLTPSRLQEIPRNSLSCATLPITPLVSRLCMLFAKQVLCFS